MAPRISPLALALTSACVVLGACVSSGNRVVSAPTLDRVTGCNIASQTSAPLLVEWSGATRGQLEALRAKHLVAARYTGCDLEVLPACAVRGAGYAYVPLTPKHDLVRVKDEKELYANIPMHAASLSAKLRSAGELDVSMSVVGRFDSRASKITPDMLEGECAGATHVVTGLTTGAFRFFAGASDENREGASVAGFGGGAGGRASTEVLNQDGDDAACARAGAHDSSPPYGCGAIIRIELAPIGAKKQLEPVCGAGLAWDGKQCASTTPPPVVAAAARSGSASTGMVRLPGAQYRWSHTDDVISIASFDLDATEVTVADFKRCVDAGRCAPGRTQSDRCNWGKDGRERHPINCVTWDEAKGFCEWTGKRLPTEQEWEYAAAGQSGAKYPWGNAEPDDARRCKPADYATSTCPVASVPAGRFGLFDMAGNVREWTLDAFCSGQKLGSCAPTVRSVRNGMPVSDRSYETVKWQAANLGFRCARSATPAASASLSCAPGSLYALGACVPDKRERDSAF